MTNKWLSENKFPISPYRGLQVDVKLPQQNRPMVRFAASMGNQFYLSDMSFDNNCVWLCDLEGRVRNVAGIGMCFYHRHVPFIINDPL